MQTLKMPYYDPTKSYEENYQQGPFGGFRETRIEHRGESTETFLGNQVYKTFGIPAGPLLNAKFVEAAFRAGFDLPTYKTVRTGFQKSLSFPNVVAVDVAGDLTLDQAQAGIKTKEGYGQPLSITNSFAVPSLEPDQWQPDMAKAVNSAGKGQVMIASFQGTNRGQGAEAYIQDYALAAKLVKETGAKILEANLSCPNEGTAALMCFDVERVVQIAKAIKKEINDIPLLLKLSYFKDDELLRQFVKKVGPLVQGLVAINTIPAKVIKADGSQALPGEGRTISGVCGTAIKWAGLTMVKRLLVLRQEFKLNFIIVGVGGIMTESDYREYRQAGADAALSATGSMWNHNLAREIYEK